MADKGECGKNENDNTLKTQTYTRRSIFETSNNKKQKKKKKKRKK